MKKSALRASYADLAGVMFGLVLDLNPIAQLLLGLAAFIVAFAVFALLAK